jgi:hypothetical protein
LVVVPLASSLGLKLLIFPDRVPLLTVAADEKVGEHVLVLVVMLMPWFVNCVGY